MFISPIDQIKIEIFKDSGELDFIQELLKFLLNFLFSREIRATTAEKVYRKLI